MRGRPTDLLKPRTWRAARAYFKALAAYHRHDYEAALLQFDKAMELDVLRTDVHIAFRTILLGFNSRPTKERIDLYKRILAGEFGEGVRGSKYARAYVDYFLGYHFGRPDIVSLWSRAYGLKPTKGFAARYLPLPESPIISELI